MLTLISHGFDTVRISFDAYNCNKKQLQQLNLLFREVRKDSNESASQNYKVWFSWHNNVQVTSTIHYSHLEFSVSTIVNGNNSVPLPHERLKEAFQILNDRLAIYYRHHNINNADTVSIFDAKIQRVDYNFNFASSIMASSAQEHISSKSDYLYWPAKMYESTKDKGKTMKYVNNTRGFMLYSQVSRPYPLEVKHGIVERQLQYNANDLIRLEFLLENNYFRLANNRITVEGLCKRESLIKVGKQTEVTLDKLVFVNPECESDRRKKYRLRNKHGINKKEVQLQCTALLFNYLRYNSLKKAINQMTFTSPQQKNVTIEWIDKAFNEYTRQAKTGGNLVDIPVIIKNTIRDDMGEWNEDMPL